MNTPQAVQLLFGASLVFIAALFAVVLLRKASAAVRHLAAALGLLGVLVLPFVPVPASLRLPLLPSEPVREPQAEPRLAERAAAPVVRQSPAALESVAPVREKDAKPVRRESPSSGAAAGVSAAPVVSSEAAVPAPAPLARFGSVELLAVGLWLIGAVVVLLRFGLGVVRLRRLLSRATPAGTELRMDAGKAARRLGLTREVPVLTSTEAFVPMAAGVFSPVLLLPEAAETWPAERREAVLLHELAHVSRNDCAWQAVATCARALYWPLPFVWALERSLRRDAERAADDLALSSGTRASEYAEALVFAVRAARRSSLAPAFGMGKPSELEGRVRAILDPGQRRGTSRPVVAGAALVALLVVAFAGAVTPFEAEGRPAVPVDHAGHHGGDAHVDEAVHEAVHEAVREVARQSTRTAVREAVRASTSTSEAVSESVSEAVREAVIEAELDAKSRGMSAEVQRAMARAAKESAYLGERMSVETRRAIERAAQEAVFAGRRSGRNWYSRGSSLHNDERHEEAIEAWKRSIEEGQQVEASTYNIACAYARLGQKDLAFEWLKKAAAEGFELSHYLSSDDDLDSLRSDSRFAELKSEARKLKAEGSSRAAKVAAERMEKELATLKTGGSTGSRLYDKAHAAYSAGAYREAAKGYEAAAAAGYREGTAYYNAACSAALAGDSAQALALLEKAVEGGYTNAGHMASDDDLETIWKERAFKDLLERAEELDVPMSAGSTWRKAFGLSSERSRWREAATRLEKYLVKHPGSRIALFNLGLARLRADEYDAARIAYEKVLATGYRKSTTLYNLACVEAMAGRTDRAFARLDEALDAGFDGYSTMRYDDDLDPIRSDSRFRDLLRKARANEKFNDD